MQIHKEKGRKNPAKSYMWVLSSGEYEQAHPIRLYEYQPGCSGSYAEEFFKGFNGILQTDGYTVYQKVPCHAHSLCWAHARRYFVEAIPPDLPKSKLGKAVQYSLSHFELQSIFLAYKEDKTKKE